MRPIEVTRPTFEAARKSNSLHNLACGLHDVAILAGKDPFEDKDALIAKAGFFDYRRSLCKELREAVDEFNIKYNRAKQKLVENRSSDFDLSAIQRFIREREYYGGDADFAEVVRHFCPDGQQSNKGRRLMHILKTGFPKITIIKD
jgi:hypothetical protein